MKKLIYLFVFLLLISFVSAYSRCVDYNDERWCCDEGVICDPSDPSVCGKDSAWCDNYNNPQLSCIPGEDWCCYSAGYIADYSAHKCCSPDFPFYITQGVKAGRCSIYNTLGANNYYTNLKECDYLYSYNTGLFAIEEICLGYNYKKCKLDGIAKWINGWDTPQIVVGKCGVECLKDTDCPKGKFVGDKFCSSGNIAQTYQSYSCTNYDYKCEFRQEEKVVETCDYKCEGGFCIICDEGDKKCVGNELKVCEDNKWITEEVCETECIENGEAYCKPPNIFLDFIQSIIEWFKSIFT